MQSRTQSFTRQFMHTSPYSYKPSTLNVTTYYARLMHAYTFTCPAAKLKLHATTVFWSLEISKAHVELIHVGQLNLVILLYYRY